MSRGRETLITVGMPVHNAMPWLPEAIASLLSQTCHDFEILAIVDGGTDESLACLRSLREPRLRVLAQTHAGVTATLNRLLRETQTPWLVRQDADDVSYPSRIERILRAIQQHPDAGLIYSEADYHPRDKCLGRFRCSRGTAPELRALVQSGYLLSICHSTVALQVEKAIAAGAYRMNIHAEDADLWWRMALQWDLQYIPETLVGFRQHAQSVSDHHAEEQQLAGLYVQYLLLSDLWRRQPRSLDEVAPALRLLVKPSALRAKEALRHCNMHLAGNRRLRALASLARAFTQSPGYVCGRARDELGHAPIANGLSPQLFLEQKEALWS